MYGVMYFIIKKIEESWRNIDLYGIPIIYVSGIQQEIKVEINSNIPFDFNFFPFHQ